MRSPSAYLFIVMIVNSAVMELAMDREINTSMIYTLSEARTLIQAMHQINTICTTYDTG